MVVARPTANQNLTSGSDIQNPDNPPDPARNPLPKAPTPPNSPDSTDSPEPPSRPAAAPVATATNRQSPGSTTRSVNLSRLAQEYNREAAEMLEETNQKIKALVESPTQPLMETPLMTVPLAQPLMNTPLPEIKASTDSSRVNVTFSDIINYRDYLNSKEYKQQLSPEEQIDLSRKANQTVDPIMNQFRSLARAEAGENLPAPHPYFRSFETELELSEEDRIGIETARNWAGRQPKALIRDTEPPYDPER